MHGSRVGSSSPGQTKRRNNVANTQGSTAKHTRSGSPGAGSPSKKLRTDGSSTGLTPGMRAIDVKAAPQIPRDAIEASEGPRQLFSAVSAISVDNQKQHDAHRLICQAVATLLMKLMVQNNKPTKKANLELEQYIKLQKDVLNRSARDKSIPLPENLLRLIENKTEITLEQFSKRFQAFSSTAQVMIVIKAAEYLSVCSSVGQTKCFEDIWGKLTSSSGKSEIAEQPKKSALLNETMDTELTAIYSVAPELCNAGIKLLEDEFTQFAGIIESILSLHASKKNIMQSLSAVESQPVDKFITLTLDRIEEELVRLKLDSQLSAAINMLTQPIIANTANCQCMFDDRSIVVQGNEAATVDNAQKYLNRMLSEFTQVTSKRQLRCSADGKLLQIRFGDGKWEDTKISARISSKSEMRGQFLMEQFVEYMKHNPQSNFYKFLTDKRPWNNTVEAAMQDSYILYLVQSLIANHLARFISDSNIVSALTYRLAVDWLKTKMTVTPKTPV